MPYCDSYDILQVLPEVEIIQLTDDTNTAINYDVLNAAISFADTTINSYLRSRYTLPLSEIPELIKVFAIDLTIYRLHSRRMIREMPESILNSYKTVIAELGKIQKGIVSLGLESESEDTQLSDHREFVSNKTSTDRLFSNEVLNDY
jgi:phage gp36-like protein